MVSCMKQEIFDYVSARPRLSMNDDGTVSVVGGVRRSIRAELPMVKIAGPIAAAGSLSRRSRNNSSDELTSASMVLRIILARVKAFFAFHRGMIFNHSRTAAIGSPLWSRKGRIIMSTPFVRP